MRATARAPLSRSGRRKLEFPCGHNGVEGELARRVRERPEAAWVRCPRCNVVALVVRREDR